MRERDWFVDIVSPNSDQVFGNRKSEPRWSDVTRVQANYASESMQFGRLRQAVNSVGSATNDA